MNQDQKQELHISVRNLVEFVFREGDIDQGSGRLKNPDAMVMGTRIHRKIQKSMGKDYQSEYFLRHRQVAKDYELVIEGRADGIYKRPDGVTVIDEIKGILRNPEAMTEPVYVHVAQVMCYAYIYALQNDLPAMGIRMIYVQLEGDKMKDFEMEYSFEELESWFLKLMESYGRWAHFQAQWQVTQRDSIEELTFPFSYRTGQKELIRDVYRTILREKILFLQAPTGVGKTISTIFPAVKAVGEGLGDKIFYLTSKTITASVAIDTFSLLMEAGYRAKTIQITAKEKLCPCEEMECNPRNCPYAKGHFDRVNDAVFELLQTEDLMTREVLLEQAQKHQVCPFELALDVASWSDNIICDYNYVFDPNVQLKRFFAEGTKGNYIFLVDEAHNLVERGRKMYSASIRKEDFLAAKRIFKTQNAKLERLAERCNRLLLEYKRECETYVIYDHLGNLIFALMNLVSELDEFLQTPSEFAGRKEIMEFYFTLRGFLRVEEERDERYVIYSQFEGNGDFTMNLLCVDPSAKLQECLDKGRSTVYFSATFLPINYYKRLLSTGEDNYAIYASSAFSEDQSLILMGQEVSTRYTRRTQAEFARIAEYIYRAVCCKRGNYMVFFPSYQLMQQVYEVYDGIDDESFCICQKTGMKEEEREDFLALFEEERDVSLVAFCVMGGIFGEGIDLVGEKLVGAVIVGTGLPQISNERTILKDYYDRTTGSGFDYAFRYPGLNKVLQAAGRVIRTTEDRGWILLLDERFLQADYADLYPREWAKRKRCNSENIKELIETFWKEKEL